MSGSIRRLYYSLSPEQRMIVRRIRYAPSDFFEWLSGKRKGIVPPKSINFTGSGDFEAIGLEFFGYFKEHCDLQPQHHVLDIGCGFGRMAVPMMDYLSKEGSFQGIEIMKEAVDWCEKEISSRAPNFSFHYADLENELYKSSASKRAEEYRFPQADNSIDLVILTSVFTHMHEADVRHYLKEIGRVLREDGRALISWFILDPQSLDAIGTGTAKMTFIPLANGHFSTNPDLLESNMAFGIENINKWTSEAGMDVSKQLLGKWRGSKSKHSYQDITIIHRKK